jgi:hypothetical protein
VLLAACLVVLVLCGALAFSVDEWRIIGPAFARAISRGFDAAWRALAWPLAFLVLLMFAGVLAWP